jgi:hypothetical protein
MSAIVRRPLPCFDERLVGAEGPPERHADRVVDEMSRLLVRGGAGIRDAVAVALNTGADGNPKAQARLAERIRRVGAGVVTRVDLVPGKRGGFTLSFCYWTGWNPERDDPIETSDALPAGRVWLAYWFADITGEGGGKYSNVSAPGFLVTHHALSRLAQRCGARTAADLKSKGDPPALPGWQ